MTGDETISVRYIRFCAGHTLDIQLKKKKEHHRVLQTPSVFDFHNGHPGCTSGHFVNAYQGELKFA